MTTHSLDLIAVLGHSSRAGQITLLVLACVSVFTWGVIVFKVWAFRQVRNANKAFNSEFERRSALELFRSMKCRRTEPASPLARLLVAAVRDEPDWGIKANASKLAMQVRFQLEVSALQSNLDWLATVASTAPYIGLLGTVVGVMDAFAGLSGAQNTGLASVAPGISEALVTTAMGLVTAIPASIAFNRFQQLLGELVSDMEVFALELTSELGG